jgi:uncharacterized protein YbcV (DUF1398 family)
VFRFLTRLRKDSGAGKRFRNYIFYAVGEIVLVVIGILIALQINNWNNQRKLEDKEVAYLKDIKENLLHDYENLEAYLAYNELKIALLDSSIVLVASEKPVIEVARTMNRRMPELTTYRYFYPRRTAFDNMVNAENIALIRDEALRESLSEYYFDKALINTTQERTKTMNRTFVDYFSPFILNRETLGQFYKGDFVLPGPRDIDFRGDPELISIMFSLRMATDGQRMEFELKRDENIALRELIETILQSKD